ncbi:MAG: response regulator transcription factor [Clostridium sp.]|jgi:DNA-binding response OmpR family regulator|uniref:response regulator transcription factor n=1 Tax=Clostridium sp. TaxID=1506 RepID=UPI0025C1A589|nr:response regulator transcription factor [Clostridium sp.]MCH3965831.1 response regulator transcription factor [Clostridium sp.]MCI1716080.1 response regulator transcription factor [Clostridium sp.]MCI1800248.1 response regulator transcription factor [Clostridium sp.]MCI1814257.1 response regulator transcription factor [Clostridium sp.]MCI1871156.1 response regulator transcription factor [Clostridium sp.]
MRLLLIEDEIMLSDALAYILRKNNYNVDVANDGIEGQEMAETEIYDIIILDRMLPGKDGLDILKGLRKKGIEIPVIILTAMDSVENRVEGLDNGADDYLIKPFSKEELLARIRALGRRNMNYIQDGNIKLNSLLFDPLKGEIEYNENKVKLTSKESQLLELLARNKNQVITRDQILDRVWGIDSDIEMNNNIEVYFSHLRKKLKCIKSGVVIETVRGVGYCLKEI